MPQPFERKLCSSERLWVAVEEVNPSFCVQICLAGEGELDPARLEAAVAEASAANPGARLRLAGHLWRSRWRDSGAPPPVEVVDAAGWDGLGPRGMPSFRQTFDVRRGPTSGVVVLRGEPFRVLFRSLHATMDGVGLLTWMEDVFRVLRGEPPVGAADALSDVELARELDPVRGRPVPVQAECYAPTGAAHDADRPEARGFDWRRVRIEGHVPGLLGRVIRIVADEARTHGEALGGEPGKIRVSVPVDMRRHRQGLRATSNLASGVFVEVEPETTAAEIRDRIRVQVEEQRDLDLVLLLEQLVYVPLAVVRWIVRRDTKKCHAKGRYPSTATVSTLGKRPLEPFQGGGFRARELFILPSTGGVESCPLTVAMVGTASEVQISITAPHALAGESRLEALAARIAAALRG